MSKTKPSKTAAGEGGSLKRAAFARALAQSEFGKYYWDDSQEKARQADGLTKKSKGGRTPDDQR